VSTYRSDNAVRLTVVLNIDTDIPWIAQATAAAAMRDAFGHWRARPTAWCWKPQRPNADDKALRRTVPPTPGETYKDATPAAIGPQATIKSRTGVPSGDLTAAEAQTTSSNYRNR
jgi:hypothetical protein